MISEIFVESWRVNANWQTLAMVEQDLIISRALVCLYENPTIKNSFIFRGGTALNKLYIKPAARYSEDIDLVQLRAEPIGEMINLIREILQDWLGEPKWKTTERSTKLIYQYEAINRLPAKLKLEINTTEHFQVLPLKHESFVVDSDWFHGDCEITTHTLEELMATKLRALYQRRKGRDLFDLWLVFSQKLANIEQTIEIFQKYCSNEGNLISKDLFRKNLELKKLNRDFQVDMNVLLPHQTNWNFDAAFDFVQSQIVAQLP